MKTNTILFTLSIVMIASCNNNVNTKEETKETTTITNQTVTCYEYAKDSSKVSLNIVLANDVVTGDLLFDYYEKDKNSGTIEGKMKGDTLFADYSFMSEGIHSVREIVFLRNGNDWVEGYGEVEELNGKFVFKTNATLTFNSNIVLQKIPCK